MSGRRELWIIWREHPTGNEWEKKGCFIWEEKGTGQCGKKERCIIWDRKDGRWMNGIKKRKKREWSFSWKVHHGFFIYLSSHPVVLEYPDTQLFCLGATASHKANSYQNIPFTIPWQTNRIHSVGPRHTDSCYCCRQPSCKVLHKR